MDWNTMTTREAATRRLPWDAENPYSFYEQRRRAGDLVWDEMIGAWLVLGYDAAREVLSGSGWTSDPLANPTVAGRLGSFGKELLTRIMLFAAGEDHARLRGPVRDVFTPSSIAGLNDGIEAIASAVIDHPAAHTPFDFVDEIALPIAVAVTGEWLDLDAECLQLLRAESLAILRLLGAVPDADDVAAGTGAFARLVTGFLPLAADRRSHPGDDLLSLIASDDNLLLDDVVMTTILIAVAGHEITHLLGAAMTRLLTVGPDGNRIVDALDTSDPSLIAELLRLDGPVQATPIRTATECHVIADTEIAAGQQALVVIAAANRDPAVFDQPGQFRLGRTAPAPLSFGHGPHHCLGASLARLETTVALRKTLARSPKMAGPVVWHNTPAIRGPLRVPIIFGE
jgi:cytochrome P450